jgi:protein translocase SecG subunit
VCSILTILLVLVRQGEGGDLAAAFGGGGETAFGTKDTQVIDKIIRLLGLLIFVLAITIALIPRSTVSIPDAGPAITGAP